MKKVNRKLINAIDPLIDECDRLWRHMIKRLSRGRCQICGVPASKTWLQAAHIIRRAYWSVRWHPKNGLCVCQDCHSYKIIMDWLRDNHEVWYEWIMDQKRRIVPHREIDLEDVLKKLQAA